MFAKEIHVVNGAFFHLVNMVAIRPCVWSYNRWPAIKMNTFKMSYLIQKEQAI